MSDATQVLRLLGEVERQESGGGEERPATGSVEPTAGHPVSMTSLLASLLEHDFDLGRAIVDTAHDA